MRASEAIARHRAAVLEVLARHGLGNVRVFGSAARGDDRDGSDVDLLVDAPRGTTLLTLARARREAESIAGVPFDIHTFGSLGERIREGVLRDARPL
jgi:predicted nucleotidyltransferase